MRAFSDRKMKLFNLILFGGVCFICLRSCCEARIIRKKELSDQSHDYEASGDYFEVTVNNAPVEVVSEASTSKESSSDDDGGVTCSETNITSILDGYDLDNHVLVIYKINVSANERELVLFLNLAKRFNDAPSIFSGFKFVVVVSDNSSDAVLDYIEVEALPSQDIVVVSEEDIPDFGFVIDLDELHVLVVDPCGKLTFIVVPPWSSAQHPYVKAALISTIIDLPCGCPSNHNDTDSGSGDIPLSTFTDEIKSTSVPTSNVPVIDIETDELENIEDFLDNANALSNNGYEAYETELPLRIIVPSVHMHFDNKTQSYWKYDQMVLKTGDAAYHQHLQHGENLIETWKFENITAIDSNIFVGNRSLHDVHKLANGAKTFVDRRGQPYKLSKAMLGSDNIFEIVPINVDIEKVAPTRTIQGVRHHYEQLNRWLLFKI